VADEVVNKLGAMLEELGARFELVVEAVSGFGGRLDALRDEIFGQFAEVGGQIRFLSEQIAENRRNIIVTREDLGAEMIRVGEALGKARVEFREELSGATNDLRGQFSASAGTFRDEAARAAGSIGDRASKPAVVSREELGREIAETAKAVKREIAESAELAAKRLQAELKQTNKSLANLVRKFDRFDDRITVQTRDQDQRLKKVEKKRAS
jgi:hypothetical protein